MKFQKITSKRAIIAFILLVISILSITTLCYNMAEYMLKIDGISYSFVFNLYCGEDLTANGFGLLGGSNTLIDGTFNSVSGTEFTGTAVVYQLFSILILIISIASFALVALYFFSDDKRAKKLSVAVLAVNIVCAVAYLIIGICFMSACKDTYVNYFAEMAALDTSSEYTDNKFVTYSYVPLILSAVAAAVYFVSERFIKEDFSFKKLFGLDNKAASGDNGEMAAETAVTQNQTAQSSQNGAINDADIDKLIKLKQLYDDGIITEEEFTSQKELILNAKGGRSES